MPQLRRLSEDELLYFEFQYGGKPVVSLEDFFTDNECRCTIGANLWTHPGLTFFYKHLKKIRSRTDVENVLMEIKYYEFIDEYGEQTKIQESDRIYIITRASLGAVTRWMKPLGVDEIEECYVYGDPPAAPMISEGYKIYAPHWLQ